MDTCEMKQLMKIDIHFGQIQVIALCSLFENIEIVYNLLSLFFECDFFEAGHYMHPPPIII